MVALAASATPTSMKQLGKLLSIFLLLLCLAPHAHAAVAFDATSSSLSTSWTHTVTGSNTGLVCFINQQNSTAPTVTYNGSAMTQFGSAQQIGAGAPNYYQLAFYLIGPATGSNTVSVSGGGTFHQAVCESVTGISQTGQPDATAQASSGGSSVSSLSSSITTVANDSIVVAGFSNNAAAWATRTNFTARVSSFGGAGFVQDVGDYTKATAGSLTQSDATGGDTGLMAIHQISFSPAGAVSAPPSSNIGLVRAFWIY